MEYEIHDQIGKGSRASIFFMEQIRTGQIVAGKIYEESGKEESLREIEVLKALKGNGAPHLIDVIVLDGKQTIIMEYVEGENLRELLNREKVLSKEETLRISLAIGEILEQMTQNHPPMYYGDLKPENVMLTKEGQVYLIDFGSVLYEGEKDRGVFGTRKYYKETEHIEWRDVYALGVMMNEMLGVEFEEDLLNEKLYGNEEAMGLSKILTKSTRLQYELSYGSIAELMDDLRACKDPILNRRKTSFFFKKRKKKPVYFCRDLKRIVVLSCITILFVAYLGILFSLDHKSSLTRQTKTVYLQEVGGEEAIKRPENTFQRNVLKNSKKQGSEESFYSNPVGTVK